MSPLVSPEPETDSDGPDRRFVFQGTEELEVRILVQARPGQDIRLVMSTTVDKDL